MTIDELIERLEEYRDALGGDAEVRLMTQSNWPFENTIFGLVSHAELHDGDDSDGMDPDLENAEEEPVVFICEGQQLRYGTKRAWELAH